MAAFSPLDSRFDRFLYATALENDGLPVSVLSVLARQDLDPWVEAERLAALPREQAVNNLAATIRRCCDRALAPAAAGATASALLELLPMRAHADTRRHDRDEPIPLWLVYGIFMFMMAISTNAGLQPGKNRDHQSGQAAITQTTKAPSDETLRMPPERANMTPSPIPAAEQRGLVP